MCSCLCVLFLVDKWRKHKCVLFIHRYFLKSQNYQYFYNFSFDDYVQRNRVIKTYNVRHLSMTEGKSVSTFGLPDEKEWTPEDENQTDPMTVASGPTTDSGTTELGKTDLGTLRYDSEEEE